MTRKTEDLPTRKTVIVGFEEGDYSRLLKAADLNGVAVATFIEDAVLTRLNQWEKTNDTETDS